MGQVVRILEAVRCLCSRFQVNLKVDPFGRQGEEWEGGGEGVRGGWEEVSRLAVTGDGYSVLSFISW